jgi:hypothetical protein
MSFSSACVRKYESGVLDQKHIEWIVEAKNKGWRNVAVANAFGVSVRRGAAAQPIGGAGGADTQEA